MSRPFALDDVPAGDLVEIAGEIRRETEKAILLFDGSREAWLPKSLVRIEAALGGCVAVHMTARLAFEKGLI